LDKTNICQQTYLKGLSLEGPFLFYPSSLAEKLRLQELKKYFTIRSSYFTALKHLKKILQS